MTLEAIVDIYGSSIGEHLVSRRVEINKEGPFKGIKTYRIELYCVGKSTPIIISEKTCLITLETRDSIIQEVEKDFIRLMFEYYGTKLNTEQL